MTTLPEKGNVRSQSPRLEKSLVLELPPYASPSACRLRPRQWLVERARAVGVVQAALLAAALAKHESEVRSQFHGSARWRRGAVTNLTVLGLYLQPVTAKRL